MQGTVSSFNEDRGFGFIKVTGDPGDPSEDFYFHATGLIDQVLPSDEVTFDLGEDENHAGKTRAVNIKRVATPIDDPTKLFIGNISFDVDPDELRKLLEECGEVKSFELVYDHDTGLARGFAFAYMTDELSALRVIAQCHGKSIQGRRLAVRFSRSLDRVGNRGKVRTRRK